MMVGDGIGFFDLHWRIGSMRANMLVGENLHILNLDTFVVLGEPRFCMLATT